MAAVPKLKKKTLPTKLPYYEAFQHLKTKPGLKDRVLKKIEALAVHHWGTQIKQSAQDTLSEQWDILVRTCALHLKKKYTRRIQYNWAIFIDGTCFYIGEDKYWEHHASNPTFNKKSVAISFVCDTTKQGLSDIQKINAAKIIKYYEIYKGTKRASVKGHREVASVTSCPGTAGLQFVKDYRAGKYDSSTLTEPADPVSPCTTSTNLTPNVALLEQELKTTTTALALATEENTGLKSQIRGYEATITELKNTIAEHSKIVSRLKQQVYDLENPKKESIWDLIVKLIKKDGNEK